MCKWRLLIVVEMNEWLVLLIFRLIFTKRKTAHGPQTLRGPEGCKFNVHQTVCDKSIWGSGLGWCISKNRERKKNNYIGICPGPGRLCVFASFRSLLLSFSLKSGPLCWQSFAFSSFPSHTCPEFRLVVFKTEWLCFYSLPDHSCQW